MSIEEGVTNMAMNNHTGPRGGCTFIVIGMLAMLATAIVVVLT